MLKEVMDRWSVTDTSELYDVPRWSKGYFSVHRNGSLHVHPDKDPTRSIDLLKLVDHLKMRGLDLPVLIRFNGILRHRLREIHDAFQNAINEYGYQNKYRCVYPIKVNQQRQVVEQIVEDGREFGFGLEAGSKPELLAVVAMTDAETPIICNGFKDAEFIEMAMLAQKMGRRVIPVVERLSELDLILKYAEKVGVRPKIGMRVKLAARGSGRWESSGGFRSKFGLTVSEILTAVDRLKERNMADCLKLLHFHLGSQITNIRFVKGALIEAARVYAELVKQGTGIETIDVGGGLGVDYDGSQTNFESSVNYTLQEYANDVVYHIQSVCDIAEVPHPLIVSESGRAVVAYHCALIFEVLGVSGPTLNAAEMPEISEDDQQPLVDLHGTFQEITARNMLESYHDAQQAMEMCMNLFSTGHMSLESRGRAESAFWAICRKIESVAEQAEYVPEELQRLQRTLADTYFCNFSLFQSMPDSWAIKQLFPVMPIHRLDQRPERHAVLADITCDSDGKIDQFIDRRDIKRTLPLHGLNDQSYLLGAFLIGAYQEILGDMHNLFGDTNAVHVELNPDGEVTLESIVKGDSVSEVLDYVEFHKGTLLHRLQKAVETAVQQGLMDPREAGRCLKFYEDGLNGYTYLEDSDPSDS